MAKVTQTKHSSKRQSERMGLNKSAQAKNAEKAFDNGFSPLKTHGPFRRYLDSLYYDTRDRVDPQKGDRAMVRVYNRYVYIFVCNRKKKMRCLITVWLLPKKYWAAADKIQTKWKAEQDREAAKASQEEGA